MNQKDRVEWDWSHFFGLMRNENGIKNFEVDPTISLE